MDFPTKSSREGTKSSMTSPSEPHSQSQLRMHEEGKANISTDPRSERKIPFSEPPPPRAVIHDEMREG